MNKHYDKYLTKKYVPLYRNRHGDMRTTAMCWGFSVGDGWFDIINNLSFALCSKWLHTKREFDQINGRVGQLEDTSQKADQWNLIITQEMVDAAKQKMDEEYEKVPVALQVKEKFGTLRFYVEGATSEHRALIRMAELMSSTTCDVCSNRGRLGGRSWISVRCNEHRGNNE